MSEYTSARRDATAVPLRSFLKKAPTERVEETSLPLPEEEVQPALYPVRVVQPNQDVTPPNVMDLLVEKYTRFASLLARSKVDATDVAALRAICNQANASAEALEAEARKRRQIVRYISSCLDLLDEL